MVWATTSRAVSCSLKETGKGSWPHIGDAFGCEETQTLFVNLIVNQIDSMVVYDKVYEVGFAFGEPLRLDRHHRVDLLQQFFG